MSHIARNTVKTKNIWCQFIYSQPSSSSFIQRNFFSYPHRFQNKIHIKLLNICVLKTNKWHDVAASDSYMLLRYQKSITWRWTSTSTSIGFCICYIKVNGLSRRHFGNVYAICIMIWNIVFTEQPKYLAQYIRSTHN